MADHGWLDARPSHEICVMLQRLFENFWGRSLMRHFEGVPAHKTPDFGRASSSFARSSGGSQSFQTVSHYAALDPQCMR
jgi:hypothetical protein